MDCLDKIIEILKMIPLKKRNAVKEVTIDMANSKHKVVKNAPQKHQGIIDRFHVQKLAYDALQEMRIKHRWNAINEATNDMENAKLNHQKYVP